MLLGVEPLPQVTVEERRLPKQGTDGEVEVHKSLLFQIKSGVSIVLAYPLGVA